jgi:predicted glycogen debranching enzyme
VSDERSGVPERIGWRAGDDPAGLTREWMLTNGLGGYASGTLAGVPTRRSHGLLVAALPAPLGRTLMLNHLFEHLRFADGTVRSLATPELIAEVRLTNGRPRWRYAHQDVAIEKSIVMPYRQNTTYVSYRLAPGSPSVLLGLEPAFAVRSHQGPVASGCGCAAVERASGIEITALDGRSPPSRMALRGAVTPPLEGGPRDIEAAYAIERARGLDWQGALHSLGRLDVPLRAGAEVTFVISTEGWPQIDALSAEEARALDDQRRLQLIKEAAPTLRDGIGAELLLAADQFVITPRTRPQDEARLAAEGDGARTIIAGYP